MNQERAQLVIDILRNLHEKRDSEYFLLGSGICANLSNELSKNNDRYLGVYTFACCLVKKYSIGWELHTGEPTYPIAGYYDRDEYSNKVLWVGKQLELRQSLIRYIIAKLEADFIPTSGNYRWGKVTKNLMGMWWN